MGPSPRVRSAIHSHGLAPNFDGDDRWGSARYRFVTNSLGFRDAVVRDVPLTAATRRVLLIGDSFTEGIGVPFEQSFAGLLHAGGQQRADRIEFLNAGVVSYAPTIYYKKIKHWLDQGLRFDEVIVFSDISDVADEATSNSCLDDQKQLPKDCVPLSAAPAGPPRPPDLVPNRNPPCPPSVAQLSCRSTACGRRDRTGSEPAECRDCRGIFH